MENFNSVPSDRVKEILKLSNQLVTLYYRRAEIMREMRMERVEAELSVVQKIETTFDQIQLLVKALDEHDLDPDEKIVQAMLGVMAAQEMFTAEEKAFSGPLPKDKDRKDLIKRLLSRIYYYRHAEYENRPKRVRKKKVNSI